MLSFQERQLKMLRKKYDMYKQLNEKIKADTISMKTKNIYE